MLEFAESGHPISVLQVHCPEVSSKAKAMENVSMHYCADLETIQTVFRTIVFCELAQSLWSSRRNV